MAAWGGPISRDLPCTRSKPDPALTVHPAQIIHSSAHANHRLATKIRTQSGGDARSRWFSGDHLAQRYGGLFSLPSFVLYAVRLIRGRGGAPGVGGTGLASDSSVMVTAVVNVRSRLHG
jgi:hypothetical protein